MRMNRQWVTPTFDDDGDGRMQMPRKAHYATIHDLKALRKLARLQVST